MAHVPIEELAKRLKDAEREVSVGARYAHYRDPSKEYVVKGLGLIEATEEVAVIYEAQYGEHVVFIRPLAEWLSQVEYEGQVVPRFHKV